MNPLKIANQVAAMANKKAQGKKPANPVDDDDQDPKVAKNASPMPSKKKFPPKKALGQ